jgi:glyoxalase family protein
VGWHRLGEAQSKGLATLYSISSITYFMEPRSLGLHYVTAIAGSAQQTHDFYTRVLGLRLVKQTISFDDPSTHHFYFGTEAGAPGTLLAFFAAERSAAGQPGTGQATEAGYSIPAGSFDFWQQRFVRLGVRHEALAVRFDEPYLLFYDPDGLKLALVVSKTGDFRAPWATFQIEQEVAIKGLHTVTLTLANRYPTAELLTEVLGYQLLEQRDNRFRYGPGSAQSGALVDLLEEPDAKAGRMGRGSVHHVAFRVADEATQLHVHQLLLRRGLQPTLPTDRVYFHAMSFREPGGVLFELATDYPGFTVDESLDELGTRLQLPSQHEYLRPQLEGHLPNIG